MDGENHGKPYEQMDDLGVLYPLFLVKHPIRCDSKGITANGSSWALDPALESLARTPEKLGSFDFCGEGDFKTQLGFSDSGRIV